MPAQTITADLIRNLQPPGQGQRIIRDDRLKGFGVRITANGALSFVMHLSIDGKERRHTLGSYPVMTLTEARELARQYRRSHELGRNPFAQIDAIKTAPRIVDLWERYDQEQLPQKALRTAADERAMWRDYILPEFGKRMVKDISADDIDQLHRRITQAGSPFRANRVHSSLRRALNLAIRWGWVEGNVANGLARNQEPPRNRYASADELAAIWRALDELQSRDAAEAIALLIMTGARKSEVLSARWADIDLDKGIWIKPAAATKQRAMHHAPLMSAATELLRKRRAQADDDAVWVFPSTGASGHLTDIKKAWRQVCEKADLKGFRLHDLRHTFASHVVSDTGSLYVAGQLLGHTQTQTTARYAHLLDDAMREALDQVAHPRPCDWAPQEAKKTVASVCSWRHSPLSQPDNSGMF